MTDQHRPTLHLASNRLLKRQPSLAVVSTAGANKTVVGDDPDASRTFSCPPRHYLVQVKKTDTAAAEERYLDSDRPHAGDPPSRAKRRPVNSDQRARGDRGMPRTRLNFLYGCRRPKNK